MLLVFSQDLIAIYIFLFVTSFLKSLSTPIFNTLVGRWVPTEEQKPVFTRIGALQAGTLALAPAIGAWIKINTSVELLFLIDGISFLISVALLKELFKSSVATETNFNRITWKDVLGGVLPKPKDIPLSVQFALRSWFVFLGIGALLNAIEFAGFERINMTEIEIGYAIAAWGIGNLVAFIKTNPLSDKFSPWLYLSGLALFVIASNQWATIISFFIAGLFSSYLAGEIRSRVQKSVPENYNALPVWAYTNQVTQVINLIAYAGAGALLGLVGFWMFGLAMLALTLALIALEISVKAQPKRAMA